MCPCGSHDAELIERVTGYLADYSGMNSAKQREVRDRTRYTILGSITSPGSNDYKGGVHTYWYERKKIKSV